MKKYFVIILAILNLLPLLLFAQDVGVDSVVIKISGANSNSQIPTAKPTDYVIFIDGEEVLTSNPIMTIDGFIYLPMEEVTEIFGMGVSYNEEKKLIEFTKKSEKKYITLEEYMEIFKDFNPENISQEQEDIQKSISSGAMHILYSREMKNESIRNMRVAVGMMRAGMSKKITELFGNPINFSSSGYRPIYIFGNGEMLRLEVGGSWYSGVLGAYNRYGMDLLLAEHSIALGGSPVLLDGVEFKIRSSLKDIDRHLYDTSPNYSRTYIFVDDFAAIVGVEFVVNVAEQKIEVTTK